jgi:hypothetical protein
LRAAHPGPRRGLDARADPTHKRRVPLPTFSALVPAYLARRAEVATDQIGVSIAVHPGLRAAHVRPGQFVKVAVPVRAGVALEGVFAMWNAPLEDTQIGRASCRERVS